MLLDTQESFASLEQLVEEFADALGPRLEAIYRYGLRHHDAAGVDEGGRLLLVVDRVDLAVLRMAGAASVHARKTGLRSRIDTAQDLIRAADTHPVLTLTLLDTRELLAGSDVLGAMHVEPGDLRLRVEQALRGLTHELTDEFLFAPRNELRVERLLRRCGHRLIYLLAGLLLIKGHVEPPTEVGGLGGAVKILSSAQSLLDGEDARTLTALHQFSKREVNLAGENLYALFGATLNLLQTLTNHADTHEFDDV